MEIQTIKITSKDLSPKEYIKLLEEDKNNIESADIIPPKLGENNFGKIHVNYKLPIYEVCYE